MKTSQLRLSAFVLILGLGVFSVEVLGQGGPSSVTGYVFTPERRPVAQVWVELKNDVNRIVGRIRTDGSGRYFFNNLFNGRYSIRVLPLGTGFMEQTEEFELTGIGSRGQPLPDNQQRDVYLKRQKSGSATPINNTVVFAQAVPKEAEDYYTNAVSEIERQRVKEGIEGLERAISTFPAYFLALQKLGTMRLIQGDFENAVKVFTEALAVNSRCYECWYGIGYAKYSLGKFSEAVSATEKALVESRESVEANLLLGMACRSTKNLICAEKALKWAVKASEGTSADAHWQLALLYGRDSIRYAEAAKELESYLKLYPEAPNKDTIKKLIKQFKDQSSKTE